MPYGRIRLCRGISITLGGDAMQDTRSLEILHGTQSVDHLLDVVTVDRSEISETEGLEKVSSGLLHDVVEDTDVEIEEIEKRFANCPEAVRVIWNLYGDGIKQNTTFTGIAYASAGGREVYYNLNEIKNGKSHKEPYETYFHENGHAMDYLANSGRSGLPYSATYNNGEFIKAIQNDVDELMH